MELLNHNFEFNKKNIINIDCNLENEEALLAKLLKCGVNNTCYLIADQNEKDSHELKLSHGIEELINNHWGAIIVCPPKPIVVYKPEAPGKIVLLQKHS